MTDTEAEMGGVPPIIHMKGADDTTEVSGASSDQDTTTAAFLVWIAPALLCGFAYAFYNVSIKKASSSINPILGGVILQVAAAIFGALLLGSLALFLPHSSDDESGSSSSSSSSPDVGALRKGNFSETSSGSGGGADAENRNNNNTLELEGNLQDGADDFMQESDAYWAALGEDLFVYDRYGVLWSLIAGTAIGTAEILSFFVSGMGVPVTKSVPVVIGGSVLFGSLLGMVMLEETLGVRGWFGLVLGIVSIALVGTDPGYLSSNT